MATLCDPNGMTSTEGKTLGAVENISGGQGVSEHRHFMAVRS